MGKTKPNLSDRLIRNNKLSHKRTTPGPKSHRDSQSRNTGSQGRRAKPLSRALDADSEAAPVKLNSHAWANPCLVGLGAWVSCRHWLGRGPPRTQRVPAKVNRLNFHPRLFIKRPQGTVVGPFRFPVATNAQSRSQYVHHFCDRSQTLSGHISVIVDGPPENSSDLERAPGARSNGDEFSGGPSIVTEKWPLKV